MILMVLINLAVVLPFTVKSLYNSQILSLLNFVDLVFVYYSMSRIFSLFLVLYLLL